MEVTTPDSPKLTGNQASGIPPAGLLLKYPWLTFLLPFFVFWIGGILEPTPNQTGGAWLGLAIGYEHYPIIYVAKIAATLLAMAFVFRGYLAFPFRISGLSIAVGVVGACFWIGFCILNLEEKVLTPIGLESFLGLGERSTFNPLEKLAGNPVWATSFLAIRFIGLVLVVPVIEEFFLRGFLMRFIMEHAWWKVPFGDATPAALIVGTVVPMLMHPAEVFAAMVWFTLITWLMLRTRSLWDCVAAHCVTNLLLGLYVVTYGRWEFM